MNVDLSHKSISELRFDGQQVSEEEALVASRVHTLKACNNSIGCVIGLASIFHRLTHLDLAHNKLGSSINNTSAWLSELPPSLQILNLAHNDIKGFACKDVKRHNHVSPSDVSTMVLTALAPLCRAFPLTLALFFNRFRFPCLCELDLSYNTLTLSLSDSDAAEERWQETVERPLAASALGGSERTTWLQCTTSSISVLRLNGNSQLAALNAVLCGMDAVTHIYAAGSGVADLTAVSSAATLCPKLRALDMRGCPVVDAFIHAPRSTIATFVELLLLPSLIKGAIRGNVQHHEEEEEESRRALYRIVREVAQGHIQDIESAIARQRGCKEIRLPQVLYAALLQQVIPQVTELDAGIDVNATCRIFMDAAKEVFFNFIENNNRRRIPDAPVRQSCKSSLSVKDSSVKNRKWESEGKKRQERQQPLCAEAQKTRNTEDGLDVSSSSHVNTPRKSSPIVRKRSAMLLNSGGVSGLVSGRERRERSRSAHGVSAAAAAAAAAAVSSAKIRPAILVTSSTTNTSTTTTLDNNNNSNSNSNINGSVLSVRREQTERMAHSVNGSSNSSSTLGVAGGIRRAPRVGQNVDTPYLSQSRVLHPSYVHMAHPSSEGNNNKTNNNYGSNSSSNNSNDNNTTSVNNTSSNGGDDGSSTSGGRFQRALAALTPLLWERLEGDAYRGRLAQQARELQESLVASQDRQRTLQSTVAALRQQLQQDRQLITDQRKGAARLREQLDHLVATNTRTRRRLQKRQKEIAYGAVALQRREAVAQRREALQQLQEEEKSLQQAERRLREKVALSGAWSHLQRTNSLLQTASRATGAGNPKQLRKTRADILRENAVRERLEAMQKDDPLAYNARRFRFDHFSFNDDVGEGSSLVADTSRETSSVQGFEKHHQGHLLRPQQSVIDDERGHGKTLCRGVRRSSTSSHTTDVTEKNEEARSMYDMGHSPYSDSDDNTNDNDNKKKNWSMDKNNVETNNDRGFRSSWLQDLSLQQIFEEATAMRKRQQLLQQRMRDVGENRSVDTTQDMESEETTVQRENVICNYEIKEEEGEDDDDDAADGITIGKNTSLTRVAILQEESGPVSCLTAGDAHWSNSNATRNNKGDEKVYTNGNNWDDDDDDDDDESVNVVVSVAESTAAEDHMVSIVPPSTNQNERVTNAHDNRNIHHQQQQQQQQQEQQDRQARCSRPQGKEVTTKENEEKGDVLSSLAFLHATKRHFSVDAKSIYAEILRQQQQQQQEPCRNSTQTIKIAPDDGGEPSPVIAMMDGTANSEDGEICIHLKDVHDNDEGSVGGENTDSTRRTLFV